MSFFQSPTPAAKIEPEPQPDPAQVAARDAARAQADADRSTTADKARRRFSGRTMGTAGANSVYTDTAAGYSRPMGTANI